MSWFSAQFRLILTLLSFVVHYTLLDNIIVHGSEDALQEAEDFAKMFVIYDCNVLTVLFTLNFSCSIFHANRCNRSQVILV